MTIEVKAILFDMDNTLIDFMKMKRKSCESAIDAMISAGLRTNREEALKLLYSLYDKYGIEYQKIFQKFTQHLTGKIDYRIISYGVIAYRKMRESYLTPYSNVLSTLIQLKHNHKLAIISDAPVMEAWMRLVAIKLDNFFDVVITKRDIRRQKTHAAPFKATLKALGIKPEEAIMVGDRISRDVQTSPKVISLQGLKNQILISFGGLSAEKLLEIPLNFGHIGDLTIACDFLKTLNNLEGKTFNYENYLDFPDKEYDYYLSQGEIVLNKVGGKETILKVGNYFYEELNKMKKIK